MEGKARKGGGGEENENGGAVFTSNTHSHVTPVPFSYTPSSFPLIPFLPSLYPLAACAVFRPCRSMLGGRNYTVQHDDNVIRPAPMSGERCQRCRCQDGRLGRCMNTTRGNCMVVRPPTSGNQRSCMTSKGRMVPHIFCLVYGLQGARCSFQGS